MQFIYAWASDELCNTIGVASFAQGDSSASLHNDAASSKVALQCLWRCKLQRKHFKQFAILCSAVKRRCVVAHGDTITCRTSSAGHLQAFAAFALSLFARLAEYCDMTKVMHHDGAGVCNVSVGVT